MNIDSLLDRRNRIERPFFCREGPILNTQDSRPSSLMLEECFAAADDRFLDEWVRFSRPEFLARFIERWMTDSQPWARQQLIRYLQRDLNFPGHEVVVKRMYKHFQTTGDHELLAHFMVAFDRFVRRSRIDCGLWNLKTREYVREEKLFAKSNKTIQNETGRTAEWGTGKYKRTVSLPDRLNKPGNRLFSQQTRNHLRRKVWRHFRWLSYRDADAFLSAMTTAIVQYRDDDFAAGENIIDNWSLMHVCYFHSDMLNFGAAHTNLHSGNSLADLSAAPYQPELWQRPDSSQHLLQIVTTANSALARVWAIELLQRDHRDAILRIEMHSLLRLLAHADPRVQQFASDVFKQHQGLANLPVTTWLDLLDQCDHALLPIICAAMKKHVSAARLDTPQLIQLTSDRPVPVAEFGFELLKARHNERPLNNKELTSLSRARCEAMASEITTWALSILNTELYKMDDVVEFFDALSESMRDASMSWLELPSSRGYNDTALWARLVETPFDDVRLRVVECLHRRTKLPGAETDALASIWCAVILGVHRGGRTKLKAILQIQAVLCDSRHDGWPGLETASSKPRSVPRSTQSSPSFDTAAVGHEGHSIHAARLIPVLAVAIRSLRLPERRAALAAVASIVQHNPDLQSDIQRLLPELTWVDSDVATS